MSNNIYKKLMLVQSENGCSNKDIEKSGIYAIVNPNGKIYIGSTNKFKRRFYQYKGMHEKKQHKLYNSFLKYGVQNHKFIILECCDFEKLYERERYYGDLFNVLDREKGLNLKLPGYDEVKSIVSESTKAKIGAKHKGKIISEEQRRQVSERFKGKKQSKEHIEKRKMYGEKNPAYGNAFFKGHKHTEANKKHFSEIRKGKRTLGENSNSKRVKDNVTGEIYSSAKEVSIKFNINYSTLKARLQGRNKGDRRFEYECL